ncbi:MAG: hypothetical protein AAF211_14450 [Myxococcota bacterium]
MSLEGLGGVTTIGRLLVSDLPQLTSLDGLSSLTLLNNGATIWRNPMLGDAAAQAFIDDIAVVNGFISIMGNEP